MSWQKFNILSVANDLCCVWIQVLFLSTKVFGTLVLANTKVLLNASFMWDTYAGIVELCKWQENKDSILFFAFAILIQLLSAELTSEKQWQ